MGRRVSDGRSVKVTVPQNTTIAQGSFVFLAGVLGWAVQAVTTGPGETKELVLVTETAEYETSQINTAEAFNKGDKVYWDDTNKRFTTTATGNRFAGIVTSAKDANGVIWFLFQPDLSV